MFQVAEDRKPRLNELAEQIARRLADAKLLDADAMLDFALRLARLRNYSGASLQQLNQMFNIKTPLDQCFNYYEGLSIDEAEYTDLVVRRALWPAHFAQLPDTKFGREFAAYMERVRLPADKSKMN